MVGSHKVERLVGRGGLAEVYLVTEQSFGVEQALKLLVDTAPDLAQRLFREGRAQYLVQHPNILRVFSSLTVLGRPALLMEYVDGPDLRRWLGRQRKERRWPPRELALRIFDQILDGMLAAHAAGLIHRDLKPGNILLDLKRDPIRPRITDFGLVKDVLRDREEEREITSVGTMMGTRGYSAPEQLWGLPEIDARADVYSLGCLLYLLVCERAPFEGDGELAVLKRMFNDEYTDPQELVPDLPVEVAMAIRHSLVAERRDRLPSCHALRDVLDRGSVALLQLGMAPRALPPPPRAAAEDDDTTQAGPLARQTSAASPSDAPAPSSLPAPSLPPRSSLPSHASGEIPPEPSAPEASAPSVPGLGSAPGVASSPGFGGHSSVPGFGSASSVPGFGSASSVPGFGSTSSVPGFGSSPGSGTGSSPGLSPPSAPGLPAVGSETSMHQRALPTPPPRPNPLTGSRGGEPADEPRGHTVRWAVIGAVALVALVFGLGLVAIPATALWLRGRAAPDLPSAAELVQPVPPRAQSPGQERDPTSAEVGSAPSLVSPAESAAASPAPAPAPEPPSQLVPPPAPEPQARPAPRPAPQPRAAAPPAPPAPVEEPEPAEEEASDQEPGDEVVADEVPMARFVVRGMSQEVCLRGHTGEPPYCDGKAPPGNYDILLMDGSGGSFVAGQKVISGSSAIITCDPVFQTCF